MDLYFAAVIIAKKRNASILFDMKKIKSDQIEKLLEKPERWEALISFINGSMKYLSIGLLGPGIGNVDRNFPLFGEPTLCFK